MAAIFFLLRSIRSERKKIAAFPKLIEAMTIIVPKNDDREPHDSDQDMNVQVMMMKWK